MTIAARAFDTTAANNVLAFTNGRCAQLRPAPGNELTVNITTPPTAVKPAHQASSPRTARSTDLPQVATVVPVITSSSTGLSANASQILIAGYGFTTAGNNTVVFNNAAVGTVSAATANQLTVDFSTKPTNAGSLNVVVTTNSVSNGSCAVQVATVQPHVTSSTSNLAADATTLTITVWVSSSTAANNSVTFNNALQVRLLRPLRHR
ncbi:MAG: hypothetical protein U0892_16270 [Pirellulales bacterium]